MNYCYNASLKCMHVLHAYIHIYVAMLPMHYIICYRKTVATMGIYILVPGVPSIKVSRAQGNPL